MSAAELQFRLAQAADLSALLAIEQQSFKTDRLSQRSFRRWIKSDKGVVLVAESEQAVVGYGLLIVHQGTRLARLYSLAVSPEARGKGAAVGLLNQLEQAAIAAGKLFIRLEVAKGNDRAIALYHKLNYRTFGEYHDYYDDHTDALRMQKILRPWQPQAMNQVVPWYQQTMDFTCGPAALMMAMASMTDESVLDQVTEIELWREATTIFMTSGHGGTHPIGLALAAQRRGFSATVYVNTKAPLFLDGVRAEDKKAVMAKVHHNFVEQAQQEGVQLIYDVLSSEQIGAALAGGKLVLSLISTYRLDGKKAPHWVTLTHQDERCIYLHDPDLDTHQQPMDCQHVPIALDDFDKMSAFGAGRLRTSIVLSKPE